MKTESTNTETGYVGSLTPDQEKKLQQFWVVFLATFDFDFDATKHAEASRQDSADVAESQGEDGTSPPQDHQVDVGERAVNNDINNNNNNHNNDNNNNKPSQTWICMLKQESPDALLLRFLRARKWDVAQAHAMLERALIWRYREARVDEEVLLKGESCCAVKEKSSGSKSKSESDTDNDEEKKNKKEEKQDAHDFLEQLRLGKVYLHGTDRRGRPIGYVFVALHRPGAQSQRTLEKLIVQTIETARCLFSVGAPSGQGFCVVFDLTGFSLANMEWHLVKFIIQAFEANYPECLGSLLIHNAPWIFSGVWKIVKGLLDPVVASKVDFTHNVGDLEKYIPRENILSRFGGTDTWEYIYHEPSEAENTLISQVHSDERDRIMAERWEIAERFMRATQMWIRHVDAGETAEAEVQAQVRDEAIEALRGNYWKLDPYVRSRTNLDRTGVIGPDGVVEMYPERRTARMTT